MAADLHITMDGTPTPVYLGENATLALLQATRAEAAADAAATSEAVALAAAGPNYADTAAGLLATSEGDTFAVEDDGIVTVFRHDAGPTATELRVLLTTAALASTDIGKGAALVGFKAAGTGNADRDLLAKTRELGISLVDKSVTEGSAQTPATMDAALTEAALSNDLIVPPGDFIFSAAASIPDYTVLRGSGAYTSKLTASGGTPVLSFNGAKTQEVALNNLQIQGGTYGVSLTVSEVVENYVLNGVLFLNQTTAGFYSNQMLIVANFNGGAFDSTTKGLHTDSANTNLVSFFQWQFVELADSAIQLDGGSEAVSVYFCRFEARNTSADAGNTVIALEAAKAFMVAGSYFENTFKNILTETGSSDTVLFMSNRFSGQEDTGSGLQSETFTSDGVVTFCNNQFQQTSFGSEQMTLVGSNPGLDSRKSWVWRHNEPDYVDVTTPQITVTGDDTAYTIFRFKVPELSASNDDIAAFLGELVVDYWGRNTTPAAWISTARFEVVCTSSALIGGGVVGFTADLVGQVDRTAVVPIIALESAGFGTDGNGAAYQDWNVRVSGIPTFALGGLKVTLRGRFVNTIGRPQMTVSPTLATGPW